MVNDTAINHILDVEFHASTQITAWFILLKGAGNPAAEDTLASHAAWAEIVDYTGDRPAFVEAAAASKSINNTGNEATFAINGTCTVTGAGLVSVASGTSGILFNAVDFSTGSRDLLSGDTLNVEVVITGADA